MEIARRVLKNTVVMLLGDGINNLLNFVVLVYLARYLGKSEFGTYSFVLAYMFIFSFFSLLGINKIVVREISKDKIMEKKIIGNALTLRALLSIFAIIISLVTINLLNYPFNTKILIYIASITLLFSSLGATYSSIFQAHLKMEYSALANFIERVTLAILILLIIFFKGTLIHIMIALVVSSLSNLLMTFIFSKNFVNPKFEFDFSYSKKILKPSIPVGITVIFRSIYYRIDVIMLSLMKTEVDVGYYAAAYTLIGPLNMIPTAFMTSIFPLMSKSFKNSKKSLIVLYERSFRYMLMIGLPIAVITTLYSIEIIYFIYGKAFLESAYALSILVWSILFLFMNIVFGNVIISMNQQKITAYTAGIMAIVNIILNYILIPQYSYVGASLATVFTEALGAVIYFFYIYTTLVKNLFRSTILKLISINLLLYIFLSLFSSLPLYFLIFLSAIFYFFLIIITNILTKEELEIIKSVIKSICLGVFR